MIEQMEHVSVNFNPVLTQEPINDRADMNQILQNSSISGVDSRRSRKISSDTFNQMPPKISRNDYSTMSNDTKSMTKNNSQENFDMRKTHFQRDEKNPLKDANNLKRISATAKDVRMAKQLHNKNFNNIFYEQDINRRAAQQNLINNKKFFKFTHSNVTKKVLKEEAEVQEMAEQLPPMFLNSFENKLLSKNSSKVTQMLLFKKQRDTVKLNKKFMQQIKYQFNSMKNDAYSQHKDRQKAKLIKMQEETQPTLEETIKFRDELSRELKMNPIWKQNIQLQSILQRHNNRFEQQQRNLEEKQLVRREKER